MSGRGPALYSLLLRMLPRAFRERHGAAMADTFAALHAEAIRAGRGRVARLWLRELWDVVNTGAVLRWRASWLSGSLKATSHGNSPVTEPGRRRTIGNLSDDARLAWRATTRSRGFFALAALTLALGIGATTAMYSVLKPVVLDPLPFPEAERLVTVWRTWGESGAGSNARLALEPEHVQALRGERDVFDAVEEYRATSATLTGLGEPERINTLKVTRGLPSLMGVQPVLGRVFSAEELRDDGVRVALLSHSFWRARFGGRMDVTGSTLEIDGETWTVIGVMPRVAVRPDGEPQAVHVWLPLADTDPNRLTIARLTAGTSLAAAAARADAIVQRDGDGTLVGSARPVLLAGPLHEHLRLLMIAVLLLLGIACVNVANLLLQRGAARHTETALRAALGAGRLRLVRQFLIESVIVAAVGGLLGAALAYAGLRALLALRPVQLEALHAVHIDARVLLFALGIATAAGVLTGLRPALSGSRVDATAALGRAGRTVGGTTRFRWTLVTAEVALSFVLLVGAALVVTSLRELAARDPGYRADGLIAVEVRLPSWRYANEPARASAFEQILDGVRRMPSVTSVSLANGMPPRLSGGWFGHVKVEGRPRETHPSRFNSVEADARFLETLGQPLLAGRGFIDGDASSDLLPVILTESAARRLFPGEPATGRRFHFELPPDHTVIGVVRDIRATGLAEGDSEPLGYWPLRNVRAQMTIVVRVHAEDPQVLLDLRQVVRLTEPDAIVDVATARELLGATIARERFTTMLLSTFAALALLLAAVGLYGVLSQMVVGRTHEFGVRMALGADAGRIHALVLRSGLLATLGGLTVGALLAGAGLRVLRSEVYGLAAQQPTAYGLAAAVLLFVALAAMVGPAARAAGLDPMRAIRVD
jgi:putative ABC transport system permease protein